MDFKSFKITMLNRTGLDRTGQTDKWRTGCTHQNGNEGWNWPCTVRWWARILNCIEEVPLVHFSIQFKITLEFFNWCQLEFKLRMFDIQLGLIYRQVHENLPFYYFTQYHSAKFVLKGAPWQLSKLISSLWSVIHFEHVIQLPHTKNSSISSCLKVPKRELFERSDFPDFYTIKSLRVGDFRVKIKKNLKNI